MYTGDDTSSRTPGQEQHEDDTTTRHQELYLDALEQHLDALEKHLDALVIIKMTQQQDNAPTGGDLPGRRPLY